MQQFFEKPLPTRKLPIWIRFAITLLVVALVTQIKLYYDEELAKYPFPLYYGAVIICAVLFDSGSNFVATVASALAATYFFLSPYEEFKIANGEDVIGLSIFIILSLLIGTVVEAMHSAVCKLHMANQELMASERTKDLLLHESAHRMLNDLHMLSGFIEIQEKSVSDPEARNILTGASYRIRLLARVQQRLRRARNTAVVDMREFILELGDDIKNSFFGLRPIRFSVKAEQHELTQDQAVAVGLIIHEMVTNALKYAFPDDGAGMISIHFMRDGDFYLLSVEDDGIGMSAHKTKNLSSGSGLGQRLARAIAAQLNGTFEIMNNPAGKGTLARLRFPVEKATEQKKTGEVNR